MREMSERELEEALARYECQRMHEAGLAPFDLPIESMAEPVELEEAA